MKPFPLVDPLPGGLEAALRAARARRLRRAGISGAACAVGLLLTVSTLGASPQDSRLVQLPASGPRPVPASTAPLPQSPLPTPMPDPHAVPAARASATAAPTPTSLPTAPAGSRRPAPRRLDRPVAQRSAEEVAWFPSQDLACARRGDAVCVHVLARAGDPELLLRTCNTTRQERTLVFDGAVEAQLVVTQLTEEGEEVVLFETRRSTGTAPHEVSLPAGICLSWNAFWDGRNPGTEKRVTGTVTVRGELLTRSVERRFAERSVEQPD